MSAMQQVKLAVIGMPGHGKSTFLNALVGKRGEFAVGAGGGSCTQQVSTKEFELTYQGTAFKCSLTDTMGFPDPNPKNAATYYDSVISSCNSELNAIVWLMRCERELHSLVSQYKVLMREFNNARPPIILVVNGLENYEDDEEREERKAADLQKSLEFGKSIAEAAGVQVSKIIVGAERGDLKTKVRDELAISLMGTAPRASRMKTFQVLQDEVRQCRSTADKARLEEQKQQEARMAIEKNIRDNQEHIEALRAWKQGTCWVPFVGWIAEAILSAEIEDAQRKMGDLHKELAESGAELRDLQQDQSRLTSVFSKMAQAMEELMKALTG